MKKVLEFIKNNIITLKEDKVRLFGILTSFVLAGLHLYQFHASGFNLNCVYRFALFMLMGISAIFFGKIALYGILIAFSMLAVWINTFNNYTSFFCILLASRMYRKSERYIVTAYFVDIMFAYTVIDYEVSHLVIHFVTCVFFYSIYFYVNLPKKLKLKSDEKLILDELATDIEMKEISCYSVNVAYQKLKEARERNSLHTNEELLERYKSEFYTDIKSL